ncbi:Cell wall RBR3-like protein [Hirschfeldia incana]|nr:Cell wall RBR3-like protein [Hirschfeldia incana]
MDMKKTKTTSSSSSPSSLDHLFGPKGSTSATSASSCSTILDSIFPPPVARKKGNHTGHEAQSSISQTTDERSIHETREASYYSSSIYYGGQQHYSPPRTDGSSISPSHPHKETDDRTDDTNATSRGNWWKGSLYY